ncbi:TetR/AcrR family transcriptional regulator [Rhodococcus sp. SGAir0479]|uniref:TetR/AcrR family transcriptional regulator n=1 Tax=Rhodococcus sp. SGAir0479 TaxID=2567884 RepID=UPI0010CCC704|nr:TetR/AcrR family transcriptional regulator [Rhodococcus sp. SGAir0479]QCQ90175.1 TetR/AcrR family transcriptional regulator [Rhodococcus sp. SGAir0479]
MDEIEAVRDRKPTQRDEQKRLTRRRLLECARDLFAAHGYAAVKIDDIASAAGCSRATFYLHFTGKTDVLRKIGSESMDPRAASVYADLDEVLGTGSRAEFTRWIERAIDWFDRNRAILPAWDEALVLEPDFREPARAAIAALPDAMPAYLARWGDERRREARVRIELLVTQLERFFTRWAVQGTIEIPRRQAAEVLTDIWFPALTPPQA